MTGPAAPVEDIAREEFSVRCDVAARMVREGRWSREHAEAMLQPWAEIAGDAPYLGERALDTLARALGRAEADGLRGRNPHGYARLVHLCVHHGRMPIFPQPEPAKEAQHAPA